MDKGTAFAGFAALYDGTGNSAATVAITVRCHITVDYELVKRVQMMGDRPHHGTPIGRLPELWPFDMLKRKVVAEAERFVKQIATQGYEATQPVTTMQLWGPYTEKVGAPHDWIPEAGNHLIPEHLRRKATTVWGYRGDELSPHKGCAFFILGHFTRAAVLGRVDEQTGVLIV